jgi:putative membrane protein
MHLATLPTIALQSDWASDHATPFDWLGNLGLAAASIAAGVFLVLLIRGLQQRRRYRATAVLGEPERAELADEIARAERRTMGEIVVVVLERSDRHPGTEWRAAGLVLLCASVLLSAYMPWNHPALFFLCQLALGALGFFSARLVPGFKRAFVSEARAEEVAREQALQEFYAHGLHRTPNATGVLLFVSLLERRVIVLGDSGIDARLAPADWEATDRAILEGIRAGSLKAGLLAGIRRTADVLSEHFPLEHDDRDELPDHVIVRAE